LVKFDEVSLGSNVKADIHPDPFYIRNSSIDKDHPCHDGKGRAGLYGAESSECDSPFSLANATFKWIKENLRDEIDFVVWTGDSARHDNDVEHPRTERQVYDLNKMVVNLVKDTFSKVSLTSYYGDRGPVSDFDRRMVLITMMIQQTT